MREFVKHHGLTIFSFSFLAGVLLSILSRFVYAFLFLPKFHGSWSAAARTMVDGPGWWAYVTSPFGLTIHLAILVLMLGVPATSFLIACRENGKNP